ncbi:unnamed protein product, partial [Rotaria sp. Silwood1]
ITIENNNGNPNNMENVKQTLQDEWKKLDSTIKNRPAKIISSGLAILSSADISGDARWKPKRQKDKNKRIQKETKKQEEIPPQPIVRPISMPKEISRSRKSKRS